VKKVIKYSSFPLNMKLSVVFVSGKLKLATSDEESAGLSQRISQLFGDAVETLEQIELESHNQDPKSKEKTKLRISGYKKELNK
jgi:hypothetical protein